MPIIKNNGGQFVVIKRPFSSPFVPARKRLIGRKRKLSEGRDPCDEVEQHKTKKQKLADPPSSWQQNSLNGYDEEITSLQGALVIALNSIPLETGDL